TPRWTSGPSADGGGPVLATPAPLPAPLVPAPGRPAGVGRARAGCGSPAGWGRRPSAAAAGRQLDDSSAPLPTTGERAAATRAGGRAPAPGPSGSPAGPGSPPSAALPGSARGGTPARPPGAGVGRPPVAGPTCPGRPPGSTHGRALPENWPPGSRTK